jgi:hypothetical protein
LTLRLPDFQALSGVLVQRQIFFIFQLTR